MSITHEYLRKYSYNRWKNSSRPIQEITQKKKESDPFFVEAQYETHEQFQKLNPEIQVSQEYPEENQMVVSNQIQQSNSYDPNHALSNAQNINKSQKHNIFQPIPNCNLIHQPLTIQNLKGNNFVIKEQFNIRIDPTTQNKLNKSIQLNEESLKEQVVPQMPQNQYLFLQTNQISQYIEISQQVDEQNELKEVNQDFEEQEIPPASKQEFLLRSDFQSYDPKQEAEEQHFPQVVQMDVDYNKEEYLQIIDDYIEFIKITEYTDVQLIEHEILRLQHISSQKQFMLRIDPLIISMLFEQIPNNPYKKDSQTPYKQMDYLDLYDALKNYKSQLEQDLYIPDLSDFMHHQLSQQTLNFLAIKRQQIQWNPQLFKALQRSRNELITIFSIYNQIKIPDIVLFDQDIDAFKIQVKQVGSNSINIFQNLFSKYKEKTLKKLKDLKVSNQLNNKNKSTLVKSKYEYQNQYQAFQSQLDEFRDQIREYQNKQPIDFKQAMSLIKKFNNIQQFYIQIKQQEHILHNQGISYVPIVFNQEQEIMKIFDLMYINLKQEILKTKTLLTLPLGEFAWEHHLQQEQEALNKITRRFSLLNQFYEQSVQKYQTEYQFIRQLKKGQKVMNDNINVLVQYLDIKKIIHDQKLSMFSYPKMHLQQITVQSLNYHDLIVQTNNRVIAIEQLNQYQFIEELNQILSQENYPSVELSLLKMKNQLNSLKFSKLIQDEINLLRTYIAQALYYFPKNLLDIFAQTNTYEEIELKLGNIEQFEALENSNFESQSKELFEIFKTFFESKIQNQFDEIFIQLSEMSKEQINDWNPLRLAKRIDLLYEYQRSDIDTNQYVKKELVDQIIDYPDLRYLFQEAKSLFKQIRELLEEEQDIEKTNQSILSLILDFEAPEGIDSTLIDLKPLERFHRSFKKFDKYTQLKNEVINLGLILQQEYSQYLQCCQSKIHKLVDCIEIKINTLDKGILDNILFKPLHMNTPVPIYELHTLLNYRYSDFQSIQISKFENNQQRNIILFSQKLNQHFDEDIDIVLEVMYDKSKVHNVGIYVDQQLCFQCE
ncbi:unnamed protein product (macronuclear) [Paramecium tetraurelia]|uniref:Dynein heavy chain linker domain-containing protein n=1 Tax=Paramecium tetraurelia TaxID=5888 RepID=A0C8B7_PARTE|nr:uncharacterized protein GSPATT00036167001 [Paramecium tetraurelia]CAK67034.1 unnamed protein product [Paramecium tetraurelia]|eukprot:XP_001434431.1 hypothetical protein (macronuclear) [Paramecium tetraurelia strain d4-2]